MLLTVKKDSEIWEVSGHMKEEVFRQALTSANYARDTISNHIYQYRLFKEKYPLLSDWFSEDLKIRIGKIGTLCHRNRIYIYMMVLNGLSLDYNYLFSLSGTDGFVRLLKRLNIDCGMRDLKKKSMEMGFSEFTADTAIKWAFYRILLYTSKTHYKDITIEDLRNFKKEAVSYLNLEIGKTIHGESKSVYNSYSRYSTSLYQLHLTLYALGTIQEQPTKEHGRERKIDRELKHLKHASIANVVIRYRKQCQNIKEASTVDGAFRAIHRFIFWLEEVYPQVLNLNQVTRKHIEEYMHYQKEKGSDKWGKPFSTNAMIGLLSPLKVFFDETLAWGYEDVPQRKIMFDYDLPRRPKALPRYIPQKELEKLMESVKKLECPYQRNAIILLRWTGARREEIQRIDINALDYYEDGSPKILIPIGKTNESRWIPLSKEGEIAFKELLEIRKNAGNVKGLVDRKTKKITDYLFMKRNQRLSLSYLFDQGLGDACISAGLVTTEGKPKYTSHQFRHTMGTTMANKGASLPTIMKMLGHQSADMSIVYSTVFDETIKREYEESVINSQEISGGDYAEILKKSQLNQEEVDWIKTNFHKTYLMTGHCFHHTREQMCDFADACFFCSKYVTTKQHIPILQEKYEVELKLIKDAEERGWDREIQRHQRVATRVKEILEDLGVTV